VGCFERKQELAQLIGHGGWHAFGVVVLVKLPETFMPKPGKAHSAPSYFSMYGNTVHVKPPRKAFPERTPGQDCPPRPHGLIRKRQKSHLYDVTPQGRPIRNAVLMAHPVTVKKLLPVAAEKIFVRREEIEGMYYLVAGLLVE
jgi:hypothetical protein